MLRGNGWGIAIAVTGGLLGGMSSYFFRLPDPQALMILGATWMALDGGLRSARRHLPRWWISHRAGGFIWFVPVWILGFVIVVVSGITSLVL